MENNKKYGITFLLRKISYDSGVMVSVRHLSTLLKEQQIPHEILLYQDDQELLEQVMASRYSCLDLHVPSFQDDTLRKILALHDNVVLSIHSTMCNLQVEENSLNRMLCMGDGSWSGLRFTCPSQREVDGFRAMVKAPYYYLPNTFSYETKRKEVEESLKRKAETLENRPIKISLISAYRPMKNMITQMAAIVKLAKEREVELHIMDTGGKTPVYYNVLKIAEDNQLKTVLHPQTGNYELFCQLQQFDVGMQVSLTETFSYAAFEHMIQGVPVVGSASVPFASEVADYSDVNDIYRKICNIIENKTSYEHYEKDARKRALVVQEKNKTDAIATVEELTGGNVYAH